MKLLFICNQNKYRSPAAEQIINKGRKHKAKSAGLYCKEKERLVSKTHLDWADVVFVMEEYQRTELKERFPNETFTKRVLCLDIPDIYGINQPELIERLKCRINDFKEFLK